MENTQDQKKLKRMTIEVPLSLHRELKQVSAVEDKYIRDIVVDACKQYLKGKNSPVVEQEEETDSLHKDELLNIIDEMLNDIAATRDKISKK
ncbi:hypothetical protein [Halomonas sp. GT]|uniref:hypothetical protein n=1 Tax=Halomonas sp. GT TaxID=1971364 RepID=UPI0009F42934|nr:hypothetical protein [Halomonas sp. GT]